MVNSTRASRKDYYSALANLLPEKALVVTALGNASYLWSVVRHRPENFYFEDAMGLALPLALGLAVSQPYRPVIAVEGDGGLLMHLGALVTVGAVAPANLTILLINNGVHAASGGQPLTNCSLDFTELGRAAGIAVVQSVVTADAFASSLQTAISGDGPALLVLATEPDIEVVCPTITFDPVLTKQRFMAEIDVPRYVPTLFGGGQLQRS